MLRTATVVWLVAATLLLGIFVAVPAQAADVTVGQLVYQVVLRDGSYVASVKGCVDNYCGTTELEIPESVTVSEAISAQVTEIGPNAFAAAGELSGKVIVPRTIVTIASSAFQQSGLTSLEFAAGSTLKEIGPWAFEKSAIDSLDLPASVTSIGDYAFAETPIEDLTFAPDSELQEIGDQAFYKASALTKITIPAAVTVIGTGAFRESAIEEVRFADDAQLQSIGDFAFYSATALTRVDAFPALLEEIGEQAFVSAKVAHFGFRGNMPDFGRWVFQDNQAQAQPCKVGFLVEHASSWSAPGDALHPCSTVQVTAPVISQSPSVSDAVYAGSQLELTVAAVSAAPLSYEWSKDEERLNVPDESTLTIDNFALENVGTYQVRVSNYAGSALSAEVVVSITSGLTFRLNSDGASYTLEGCGQGAPCEFSGLDIPASHAGSPVTAIASSAFRNSECVSASDPTCVNASGVTGTLRVPESITEIGSAAFFGTRVNAVEFTGNSQLESIDYSAFYWAPLSGTLTVPAASVAIGASAFRKTALTGLAFSAGSNLESIAENAFRDVPLSSIDPLPESLQSIGSFAFFGASLTNIKFRGGKPSLSTPFTGLTGCQVEYVAGSSGWDADGTDVEVAPCSLEAVSPPEVAVSPISAEVVQGGQLELSVVAAANNAALSYQWEWSPTEDGEAQQLAETGSTLTIDNVAAENAGYYWVTVSNWVGTDVSQAAHVQVVPSQGPTPSPTSSPEPSPTTSSPAPSPTSTSSSPTPHSPSPDSSVPDVPVVKATQTVKVSLPKKLRKGKKYALPATTQQQAALSWKVTGPGKCKIKAKRWLLCKKPTGKKKIKLAGHSSETPLYQPLTVTLTRKIR